MCSALQASVEHGRLEISLWDSCFSAAGFGKGQASCIGQIVINTAALVKTSGQSREVELSVRQEKATAFTRDPPTLSLRVKLDVGVTSPRHPRQVISDSKWSSLFFTVFEIAIGVRFA